MIQTIKVNNRCYATMEDIGSTRCYSLYMYDNWIDGEVISDPISLKDWVEKKLSSRYDLLTNIINKNVGKYIDLRDNISECLADLEYSSLK